MKTLLMLLILATLTLAQNPITEVWCIKVLEEKGKYVFNISKDTLYFCNHIDSSRRFPSKKSAIKFLKNNYWNHKNNGHATRRFHFKLEMIYYVEPGRRY